jgi:hypothetical protein
MGKLSVQQLKTPKGTRDCELRVLRVGLRPMSRSLHPHRAAAHLTDSSPQGSALT